LINFEDKKTAGIVLAVVFLGVACCWNLFHVAEDDVDFGGQWEVVAGGFSLLSEACFDCLSDYTRLNSRVFTLNPYGTDVFVSELLFLAV